MHQDEEITDESGLERNNILTQKCAESHARRAIDVLGKLR